MKYAVINIAYSEYFLSSLLKENEILCLWVWRSFNNPEKLYINTNIFSSGLKELPRATAFGFRVRKQSFWD